MSLPAPKRMTVDEFLAWATTQPGRYELVAGEVVAMAPERSAHALVKADTREALKRAVREQGLACDVYPDGMTVRVDDQTTYEPDALVRCGPPLDRERIDVPDPVVVVEVLSPATQAVDLGGKLAGYFQLPSVRHYLIVDLARRSVIHHRRDADGRIETTIVPESAALALAPPGLQVPVAALFEAL